MKKEDTYLAALEMKAAFEVEPWNEKWTLEQAKQRFDMIFASPYALGYVIEDTETKEILGTCIGHLLNYLDKMEYWIDDFSIAKNHQKEGLGSKLMSFVKEDCKKRDIKMILLMTNAGYPSVSFYQKNGFKEDSNFVMMTLE